jgi:polyisoprenoid-binding protein YceI
MRKLVQLAVLLSVLASAAAAQQKFTVNPASSEVNFQLGGSGHTVHGSFHVQNGSVAFDRSNHSMQGRIVVDPLSGDSGNNSRDQKMKNEVLEAGRFTEISFEPHSFTGDVATAGDSSIQVTGTFTLHGAPHELTVPMQIHIEGNHLTAKTSFLVPYVQWGLKNPSIFVLKVAKEVGVDLKLDGTL